MELYCRQHLTFHGERIVLANKKDFVTDADMSAFYGDNLTLESEFGLLLDKVRSGKFPYKVVLAEATDRVSRQGIPAFTPLFGN